MASDDAFLKMMLEAMNSRLESVDNDVKRMADRVITEDAKLDEKMAGLQSDLSEIKGQMNVLMARVGATNVNVDAKTQLNSQGDMNMGDVDASERK